MSIEIPHHVIPPPSWSKNQPTKADVLAKHFESTRVFMVAHYRKVLNKRASSYADDISQEVFLSLLEGNTTFDWARNSSERVTEYIMKTSRHTLIDFFRKIRTVKHSDYGMLTFSDIEHQELNESVLPEECFVEKDLLKEDPYAITSRRDEVQAVLTYLNDEERAIVEEIYFKESAIADAAKNLNMSVRTLLRRRNSLEEKLREFPKRHNQQ